MEAEPINTLILQALEESNWNKHDAARRLQRAEEIAIQGICRQEIPACSYDSPRKAI
jgi:hypothetical protein